MSEVLKLMGGAELKSFRYFKLPHIQWYLKDMINPSYSTEISKFKKTTWMERSVG